MSALESHQPASQLPHDNASQQLNNSGDKSIHVSTPAYSISPLPSYTYGQSSVKRPVVDTSFDRVPSELKTNGFTDTSERDDDSPDPHEFYRRYQDSFARSPREGLRQGDIVVTKRDDEMSSARQYRRQSPPSSRTSGSKPSPLSARAYTPHSSRYASITSTEQSPLNSAKSNPALSGSTRNRQSSVKDLANRFNQTPDEVPPLPRKSNSRSTSAHSNHGNSNPANNLGYVRARTSSQSKGISQEAGSRKHLASGQEQANIPSLHQRRGRDIDDFAISPKSHGPSHIASTSYASQSMTDLSPGHQHVFRRPLFGEVLGVPSNVSDLGYGISVTSRRRGSEGSMRDPNPMFPEEENKEPQDFGASSPSAWYLGTNPTLEEIKSEKAIPELPSRRHRRTQSDFTGVSILPATTFRPQIPPSNRKSSPTSSTKSKRNSQSRIPLSTRRLSVNSDSGSSAPSTRANSAMDRRSSHVIPPTRGTSALPRATKPPRSPSRNSRSSPSKYSPRRNNNSTAHQRPSTSPRLAAYISAPLPKKSPPLRSSRPRQPVSSASTSASRARAVERFTGQENGDHKGLKQHRQRKPPELGDVDFAARRRKIQAAFTHTVQENERQEERRRASMAQERGASIEQQDDAPRSPQEHIREERSSITIPHETDAPGLQEISEMDYQSSKDVPKSERDLTIKTGQLAERSVLDMSQEDSPTLGGFNHFSQIDEDDVSTPSEREPMSAVTAGTADSVGTFFDDEPQDRSSSPHDNSSPVMNHMMTAQERSPSSPTTARRPQTAESSDKDDRESIQIMLGDTPVMEKAHFNEIREPSSREASSSDQLGNRWSMSSWTSSNKSKDRLSERQSLDNEAENRMERIDEHSPTQSGPDTHLSISTAASAHTSQPWSPATFSSPLTTRSTMDSDAYSTINRVLDHYHDPNVVSPEMMHDVQQHIFTQSPDLARQGGWDPKKVTQLYLQELARNRFAQPSNLPDPLRSQSRRQPALQSPTSGSVEQKLVAKGPEQNSASEVAQGLEVASNRNRSSSLEVDESAIKLHRASLNDPDDWNMSPSIGDWIHLQAADSPTDDKPSLPPKDWSAYKKELSQAKSRDETHSSPLSVEYRPQLPEIEGLGLEQGLGLEIGINVTSPQDDDSPTIPPPPFPSHVPPTTPHEFEITKSGQIGPAGVDNKYSTSTTHPHSLPASLPADVSTDSSQHADTRASSTQPSVNSSISQSQTHVDTTPVPSEAEMKRLTRRKHIVKELIDTEHSFCQDMKVVEDIYRGTSQIINMSAEGVKTLFINSDQIVAFSTDFLDSLKQASKSIYTLPKSKRWRRNRASNATSHSGGTDDQSSVGGFELGDEEKDRQTFIGDAFGAHLGNMEKVYTEYLRNHDAANQALLALQQTEHGRVWLKECRVFAEDLTSAWDLDSLLVKPVQRILKYPLLLDQLLEATPENHPDFIKLDIASRETKGISMRINELKKRADLMEQMAKNRKRKESDVRIGLSKAFGRRTEKLRQQVGLSDVVEDKEYNAVSEKFGSHFFQLQVVMRDVEMYTNDVQTFMNRFSDFIVAIENHIDVGQTSYPEVESKWRKFRMTTREMSVTALTDHIAAVRKNVIEPMTTLLKLHDHPQRLMQKRNKRVMDYARYKGIKDRGEKPDKKTTEQGEQFMVINESLKLDLPKLFTLTGKLVEACLNNFVHLQIQWQKIWRRKLSDALDGYGATGPVSSIVDAFTGDFAFFEAQVLSLGICNGSMAADSVNMVNMLSPTKPLTGEESARRKTSLEMSRRRTMSVNSDMSPVLPHPDFGGRNGSGGFFGMDNGSHNSAFSTSNQMDANNRIRANSALAGRSPKTPEVPGSYHSYSSNTTPMSASFARFGGLSMAQARSSVDTPDPNRDSEATTLVSRPYSGATHPQGTQGRPPSPSNRYSGIFSSAMPMSDSPREQSPVQATPNESQSTFNVIFLAASVYEFNIDRARREGGYPYLTYVAGEIFDVIGEKGELWLAKNQDDRNNQVGWIWNKHFCKLAG